MCATCTLLAAKIFSPSERLLNDAHHLVYLKANRVCVSSEDTYASALHRFVHYATTIAGLPVVVARPPGADGCIPLPLIRVFLGYASRKFKYNTIRSTLSALADWHKSKGAPTTTVSNREVDQLMASIRTNQGPAGLPQGKEGMSTAMLKLLLAHLASSKNRTSPMHDLLARDAAWLVVGFFGSLRRSELIALRISDVAVTPSHITITIRRSKTDQVGAGAQVCLAHTSGSGVAIAGPIRTLLAILQKQGAHPSSPLFPSWDYHRGRGSTKIRSRRTDDGKATPSAPT